VVAGTASAVAGRVNRHQQQKWAAQEAPAPQYYAAPAPAPAASAPQEAPAAAPPVDRIEQLTKLAELHDRGILTDDEFAAEKAKILAG
jgi:hypothetical protein